MTDTQKSDIQELNEFFANIQTNYSVFGFDLKITRTNGEETHQIEIKDKVALDKDNRELLKVKEQQAVNVLEEITIFYERLTSSQQIDKVDVSSRNYPRIAFPARLLINAAIHWNNGLSRSDLPDFKHFQSIMMELSSFVNLEVKSDANVETHTILLDHSKTYDIGSDMNKINSYYWSAKVKPMLQQFDISSWKPKGIKLVYSFELPPTE